MSSQALSHLRLPGANVAAGAQSSFRMPLGRKYHQILFAYSGVTLAQMTNIEVRMNGVAFQSFRDGTELETISKFLGLPVTAGVMVLDFERMGLLSGPNRYATAVDTTPPADSANGITPFTFEVVMDIDAAALAPALNVWAVTSPGNPSQTLRPLRKIRDFSTAVSSTGNFEISDVVRSNLIEGMAFDMSTVTFDNLIVEIGQVKVIDAPVAQINHLQDRGIRVPQANWQFVDFSYAGFGDRALNAAGAQDFRIKLNATATGQLPYKVFYLGELER